MKIKTDCHFGFDNNYNSKKVSIRRSQSALRSRAALACQLRPLRVPIVERFLIVSALTAWSAVLIAATTKFKNGTVYRAISFTLV